MKGISPSVTRGFRALLGDDRWTGLLEYGVEQVYPPGRCLFRQGDPGSAVLALVSGRVKVLGAEPDGGQLLITLRGAGDLIGEVAARRLSKRTATVETIDHCTARVLSVDRFNAFLNRHDGHSVLTDYLVTKLSQTVPYQVELVHFSPERKIARLLLEVVALADRSSANPHHIPFSQREVADALGMARSTVALHLQRLREIGALRSGPRLAVSDLDTLKISAGV
ncbi:CRP-like cAMP-binding protein [Amycolatopsis lexingtonensis]|uniref:CRP-like cAMP-binding protein n=1 Tax=Amycolatopsis lexingtonensis TaxID=218822 RepID=A0ABR9I0Q8_9PSEU|nr:Crp/Fnr family transcriptional regulator [Amycolatopsis lexingtonensis]MBE1496776.1 CRP-like cAMP-binding protein [Amycolatopsis lexingtonensis]